MNYFLSLFALSLKRLLKKPSTWVCVLLVPLLIAIIAGVFTLSEGSGKRDSVVVGFYYEAGDEAAGEVYKLIEQGSQAPFSAELCGSLDELEEKIAAGSCEFGYYFNKGFNKKLEDGKYQRLFTVMKKPGLSMNTVFNESVSAAVFKYISPDIAISELEKAGLANEQYEGIDELFSNRSFMELEIKSVRSGETVEAGLSVIGLARVLRGAGGVFMFFFALVCLVAYIADIKSGFFSRQRVYRSHGQVTAPVILSYGTLIALNGILTILCVITLFPGGFSYGAVTELFAFLTYVFYLCAFIYFLASVLPGSGGVVGLSPLLVCLCFVFSPVLFDIGSIIPAFLPLQLVFPPSLYLFALQGEKISLLIMAALGALLFALPLFWRKRKIRL